MLGESLCACRMVSRSTFRDVLRDSYPHFIECFEIHHLLRSLWRSRCIFVTGGTGFIGKSVLEKLLRSCPKIDAIYVLARRETTHTLIYISLILFDARFCLVDWSSGILLDLYAPGEARFILTIKTRYLLF
jgi:hypothetical protein